MEVKNEMLLSELKRISAEDLIRLWVQSKTGDPEFMKSQIPSYVVTQLMSAMADLNDYLATRPSGH